MINITTENADIKAAEADVKLNDAICLIDKSDFEGAKNLLSEALVEYSAKNILEGLSICMSWSSLCKYLLKECSFDEIIQKMEEASFLAEKTKYKDAVSTCKFVSGLICFYEKNYSETYNILSKLHTEAENSFIKEKSEIVLKKAEEELGKKGVAIEKISAEASNSALVSLLKLGRMVSAETNLDALLTIIANETSSALNAERCTVFMLDKRTNELWSKVATGMGTEEIRFPANKGLAGHVALTGSTINIKDAYNDERFNKEIDFKTGYVTKTILCMPIRNIKHEIVGVFQVLNKKNGIFTEADEDILIALGSSAGIALENTRLFNHQQKMLDDQKLLFASFIDTLAASIDARDKITSGHSSRVRMYSQLICDILELSEEEHEIIKHAATLHDIGKIGIRDSVLQKEGKLTSDEYEHIQQHAHITHEILSKIYYSDNYAQVADIAASHHEKFNGQGYFMNLNGDRIPLGGRILAVADVFDAITSKRHYRDKMPITEAIEVLEKGAGSHFDPSIVAAFMMISCDKMVDVFLTEYSSTLKEEHRATLKQYKMTDLTRMLRSEEPLSQEEQYFTELFTVYYTNKSLGN